MERKHNKKLVPFAKSLRKNMTKEERRLWYDFLRNYKFRFIRQKIIGKYIVDFYCAKAKIAIELDGSEHYIGSGVEKDKVRTSYLEKFGLEVIRIPNNYVNGNFFGVCEYIDKIVNERIQEGEIPQSAYADSSLCTREPKVRP